MKVFSVALCAFYAGVSLLLLSACGVKGPLSLDSFEAPESPSELTAVHREQVITITWQYPKREKDFIKGFVVERAENEQPYIELARLPNDAVSYQDRSFVAGKTYIYRIIAVSQRDRQSDEPAVLEITPRMLPKPPTSLRAEATDTGVVLSWDAVGPDVLYNLYKSTSAGQCGSDVVNEQPLREPRYVDAVEPAAVVYYCVRSLYDTKLLDEGFPSEELAVMPSIYIPRVVQGLHGVASPQGVQLIWHENHEEWIVGYVIYRKGPADTDFRPIGESPVPAWIDTKPLPVPAWYAVAAQGPLVTGRRSEAVQILPYQEP